MQPKSIKWLADIQASARFILEVTAGKSLDDYRSDALLRAGVERHFEIIGEAVGRISRADPETAERISDAPRIVAFRNLLIHGYDLIEHASVWAVVQGSLPALSRQVEALIAGASP